MSSKAVKKQRERCRKNRKRTQNYNTYKKGHRQSLRERVNKIKEAVPCADCKQYFPACVLDFDHLPGNKKNRHNQQDGNKTTGMEKD